MDIATKEPVIKELVRNILETKYETFNQEHIEDVKNRMIDVVGCTVGGAHASGNSILLDLITEWDGKKEATVWVHGNRVPVHNAAMINCVMCRSYDFEVAGLGGHAPGTIDVTGLTIGEYKRVSGKEVIAAGVLASDLTQRIANTEGFNPVDHFEPCGTINGFGATAVAGRLWGLDEHQMLNAFGILVNFLAGSFQSITDGTHCFKIHQGTSARNAIFSVELAERGFTGIKDPLFSPRGYFPQYCRDYQPEMLTVDLGKVFHTQGMHKMVPSCYRNHTTIECGLEILQQSDISPDDIDEISIGVTQSIFDEGYLNLPFNEGDTPQTALFNLAYALSNVLLRKTARLEHYTDEFVRDPRIIELTRKVRIVPITLPEEWGAEVKIRMNNGREFSARSACARGVTRWGGKPATRDEIKEKFWVNVDFCKTLSTSKVKEALTMLENLEEVNDVSEIIKLLVT